MSNEDYKFHRGFEKEPAPVADGRHFLATGSDDPYENLVRRPEVLINMKRDEVASPAPQRINAPLSLCGGIYDGANPSRVIVTRLE